MNKFINNQFIYKSIQSNLDTFDRILCYIDSVKLVQIDLDLCLKNLAITFRIRLLFLIFI